MPDPKPINPGGAMLTPGMSAQVDGNTITWTFGDAEGEGDDQ